MGSLDPGAGICPRRSLNSASDSTMASNCGSGMAQGKAAANLQVAGFSPGNRLKRALTVSGTRANLYTNASEVRHAGDGIGISGRLLRVATVHAGVDFAYPGTFPTASANSQDLFG